MESTPPHADTATDQARRVRRILNLIGWFTLTAFVAAVMPGGWMIEIARWFGLELADVPLSFYLARNLSLMFGMAGVLMILVARTDPLDFGMVRSLGIAAIMLGIGQAIVDLQSEMPIWWTIVESISTVLGGGYLWWIAAKPAGGVTE